jgi:hypothetical protein
VTLNGLEHDGKDAFSGFCQLLGSLPRPRVNYGEIDHANLLKRARVPHTPVYTEPAASHL